MKNKNFFITTLNGMAYGLFATLIVGTIISTIGGLFSNSTNEVGIFIYSSLKGLSNVLSILTGAGIGIGIGLSLNYSPLKTIMLGVVGETAAYFSLSTKFITDTNYIAIGSIKVGDPLTIYLVCIAVCILIDIIFKKKTAIDILIIPLFSSLIGLTLSLLIRYPAIYVTYGVQWIVNIGTNSAPFLLGIIVAVVMGMALTAPISSAAIASMLFVLPEGMNILDALNNPAYSGLVIASGAAVIGCSTQMIGFAIQSIYDNDIGSVLSIGIGTSMLQFKNIMKKPIIWLPTIIASAILGPISTCIFKTICMGASAGMGTAGLVGQIGTIESMGINNIYTWISIIGLQIIAPAILVFLIDLLFRKLKLIKKDDLKL